MKDQKRWDNYVRLNTDPYGKTCIDVARRVMEILDKEKDFDYHEVICRADKEVKAGGITGFMAGMVCNIVINCHERGEEFKKQSVHLFQ